MIIITAIILGATAFLLWVGKGKNWGYAPTSLLSLLFVIPILMMLIGLI